jgi:ABC-2 type transport system permease protein
MMALVAAEWRKLVSQRSTWLIVAVGQALIVAGVSGLLSRDHPEIADVASRAVGHLGLVSLLSMTLGILVIAGEYRHKTVVETFLITPRRHRVVTAKLLVSAAFTLAYAMLGAIVALVTAAVWLRGEGGLDLTAELWRTLIGAIVWNVCFAVAGVGIGAAARNLAGAIAIALGWIALVEGVVGQLIGESAGRWLPFQAGMALGRIANGAGRLDQGTAALTLVGYAVALAVAGYLVTGRRDIQA